MATLQEIDARIAALQGLAASEGSRYGATRIRKQIADLNTQRYNLTASDAELNARIAAAQKAAANDDSRYGRRRNTLAAIAPLSVQS